jgi:hypothetical protein
MGNADTVNADTVNADTVTQVAVTAATDAGLFALWNPSRFSAITDYSSWEASLGADEDITSHAAAGDLVPIGIGADGSFRFLVRTDSARPAVLTEREQQYTIASSKPYLLCGDGTAHLSGIEYVSAAPPPATVPIGFPEGRYGVTVHLIDWAAEPGAQDAQGKPAPDALPDIVVLVSPAADDGSFRTAITWFGTAR